MAAKIDVERVPAGSKVELYISPSCPYCAQAMAYYDKAGVAYLTYDAQNDGALRKRMFCTPAAIRRFRRSLSTAHTSSPAGAGRLAAERCIKRAP